MNRMLIFSLGCFLGAFLHISSAHSQTFVRFKNETKKDLRLITLGVGIAMGRGTVQLAEEKKSMVVAAPREESYLTLGSLAPNAFTSWVQFDNVREQPTWLLKSHCFVDGKVISIGTQLRDGANGEEVELREGHRLHPAMMITITLRDEEERQLRMFAEEKKLRDKPPATQATISDLCLTRILPEEDLIAQFLMPSVSEDNTLLGQLSSNFAEPSVPKVIEQEAAKKALFLDGYRHGWFSRLVKSVERGTVSGEPKTVRLESRVAAGGDQSKIESAAEIISEGFAQGRVASEKIGGYAKPKTSK